MTTDEQIFGAAAHMPEMFSIMDAASADYAKRQMDKADAEFERAVLQDCPECGSTMIDTQCSNKARHE